VVGKWMNLPQGCVSNVISIDAVESWGSSIIIFLILSSQHICVTMYLRANFAVTELWHWTSFEAIHFPVFISPKFIFKFSAPSTSLFLSDFHNILICLFVKGKIKLSLRLTNQALRHEGVWWSRRIDSYFLDLGIVGDEWSASRPGRFIPRERAPVPIA
jgi:hypothetical protein